MKNQARLFKEGMEINMKPKQTKTICDKCHRFGLEYKVELCNLHASVQELLQACKAVLKGNGLKPSQATCEEWYIPREAALLCEKAILKAEGGK